MFLLAAALTIAQQLAKLQQLDWSRNFVKPTYVVFDRWPNHAPRTIFATMMNGDTNTIEVVAYRVTRAGALRRLATYQGDVRSIDVKDVTGDGIPELMVTGSSGNRSTALEIVSWDGRAFHQIGEMSTEAGFIDIDGDGIPEIIEGGDDEINECDARTGKVYVEKLKNGHFEVDPHPHLVSVAELTGDQRLYWFLPDRFSTKCTLRVVNKGAKRITLTLRDEDGDADDPIVVHDGTQPIELPSRCTTADVTITGPHGATVLFLLESK